MAEEIKNPQDMTPEEQEKYQLAKAKEQAKELGISFSPNIGLNALNEKIDAKLEEEKSTNKDKTSGSTNPEPEQTGGTETSGQRAAQLRKNATKLVRVNVACMNPSKKEWDGEIISVSNRYIGSVKKFVKFGTEDGYHIPQVILDVLKARRFQQFVTKTNERGMKYREGKLVPEFNIQELPPLTQDELDELARKQAAAQGKV